MSNQLLRMDNVHKRFPGVYALKGVSFECLSGEVHALLGENGAGKSTLMKILGGIYRIDEGTIEIEGKPVTINKVTDAQAHGIRLIHQEISLVPYLSIAENIFLAREPLNTVGLIDWKTLYQQADQLLRDYDLAMPASTLVKRLTVAEQQMIEIIKAVSFQAKIIVMDEPTSSLTDKEVEFLFRTIRHLKSRGVGIVYISHRMNELFAITDRITVLRDGSLIGTVHTRETSSDALITMMVGRELTNYYIRDFADELYEEEERFTLEVDSAETDAPPALTPAPQRIPILEVRNLTKRGQLHDINFALKQGEILGFAGLVGAGRTELMQCLFGLNPFDEGEIHVGGQPVSILQPNDAIRHGIAYVTENRKEEGLFLIRSVEYNITIKILHQFMKWLRVSSKYEHKQTDHYIEKLAIKTPSRNQEVRNLSGGNQQKVLISRWLATKPRVLILDEPTRGVDVGAKAEIYSIMNDLLKDGVSIIMVSSELSEVMNMSDRIAVMHKGRIQTILNRNQFSQETIMYYATGGESVGS